MGYAASLFNMMRNTGAAIGISLLTAILVSHQQIHQSRLAEHFSIFDAWRMSEQPRRDAGQSGVRDVADAARSKAGLGDGLWHQSRRKPRCWPSTTSTGCWPSWLLLMIPFYFVLRKAPMTVTAESGH